MDAKSSVWDASAVRVGLVSAVLAGSALLLSGCGDGPDATAGEGPAEAATATVAAAPTRQRSARRYQRISEALDAIARRVSVPVVLPSNLPNGMKLATDPVFTRDGGAQLYLRSGDRNLVIQYGRAGFDGCGPTDPQVVAVGTQTGVMQVHRRGKRPVTTLVWPATLRRLEGQYGLSGDFSGRQLLRFARSMRADNERQPRKRQGC